MSLEAERPGEPSGEARTLLYWLANEDLYTSEYVRSWLVATPEEEANETLARIAESAAPEPRSLLRMLFGGLLMIFTVSGGGSTKGPAGRKAGTRAALLLAGRGDARAIPPLARVYENRWMYRGKYQAEIEKALTQLLESVGEEAHSLYSVQIAALIERIWNGRGDLTEGETALLLAAMRGMKGVGDGRGTLERIASSTSDQPNRARVKKSAASRSNQSGV